MIVEAFDSGRLLTAACAKCGDLFSWLKPNGQRGRMRKFCGAECKAAEGQRLKEQVACASCGAWFRPRPRQRFCGLACRPATRKVYPTVQERQTAQWHRRRAWKRGAGYERFTRKSIYERDGWLCKLCGDPVDRSDDPDPHLRPSLDHILPLARGGAHSRSNVQCAHWICNSRKAAKLPQES